MSLASKADRKAAADAAAWMFNVVTSVGIILVNKALMATYGFSFGKLQFRICSQLYKEICFHQLSCIHGITIWITFLFSFSVSITNFNFYSHNINRYAFCHHNLDDGCSKVAGIHPTLPFTVPGTSKIRYFCKLLYSWNECQSNVELSGILSGGYLHLKNWDLAIDVTYSLPLNS